MDASVRSQQEILNNISQRGASKIYSLQVFRGVAAILVLLFHATSFVKERFDYEFLGQFFAFGHTGVDFFFVLSGFIISYTYMNQLGKKNNVWEYFYKRLFRIYPLYWLVASAKVALIVLIPATAKAYEQDWSYILQSYLLIPQQMLPLIGAAWTLSHELLFYFIFALALLLPIRMSALLTACWVLATLGFYVAVRVSPSSFDNYLVHFLLNERNLEFLLGCLGAYIIRAAAATWSRYSWQFAGGGLILLTTASLYLNRFDTLPSYLLFFGVPSFLLIVGSTLLEQRTGNRWPSFFVLLGDASYSIYLTHALFMNAFLLVASKLGIFQSIGMLPATLGMITFSILGGLVIYYLIEQPLLNYLRRRPSPRLQSFAMSKGVINV